MTRLMFLSVYWHLRYLTLDLSARYTTRLTATVSLLLDDSVMHSIPLHGCKALDTGPLGLGLSQSALSAVSAILDASRGVFTGTHL